MRRTKNRSNLRERLLRERRRLIADLSWNRLQQASFEGPQDSMDMATAELERETDFRIGSFRSQQLIQTDRALEKISRGTYGICEGCGRHIPAGRLRLLPFVALCVECQQERESTLAVETAPAFDLQELGEKAAIGRSAVLEIY